MLVTATLVITDTTPLTGRLLDGEGVPHEFTGWLAFCRQIEELAEQDEAGAGVSADGP